MLLFLSWVYFILFLSFVRISLQLESCLIATSCHAWQNGKQQRMFIWQTINMAVVSKHMYFMIWWLLVCTLKPDIFNVLPAKIIKDRETGRSRGFGYVTFATTKEASAALQTINISLQAMKNQVLSVFAMNHLAKSHGEHDFKPPFKNWVFIT